MTVEKLAVLIPLILSAVTTYLYWRELQLKKAKAPAENGVNVTAAVKNLSEALGLQSNELVESLTDAAKLRDELSRVREEQIAERVITKQRIEATEQHRVEVDQKIEALNREYTKAIAGLESKVSEWQAKYAELENKLHNYKRAMEILAQWFKDKGEDMPPGLELLLGDSISKFQLPKPGKP
jgi:predicted nuclease with TOPRIM domain